MTNYGGNVLGYATFEGTWPGLGGTYSGHLVGPCGRAWVMCREVLHIQLYSDWKPEPNTIMFT